MAQFDRLDTSGAVVKSPEYWARRAEWIEQSGFKDVDEMNKKLIEGYDSVLKDVERDIAEFISVNKDLISMTKTVTIKEYLQTMDSMFNNLDYWVNNGGTPETISRAKTIIDRMNTSHRLTRLEVLEKQLQAKIGEFGLKTNDTMKEDLKDVYESAYDRKQFTIARGVGYGYQYNTPNFKAIEKAILYPWAEDGSMFSERIWEYTDKESANFIKAVRRTIASGAVAQGKNPRTLAKDIVGFGKQSLSASQLKFNASRLLYTEASHVLAEAEADVSNEWGFKDYTFLATLDDRTSTICQALDGKTFEYKERKTGTNYPPMHPLCRSTTYDVVPNAIYTNRASRSIDGQTFQEIPAIATYSQWKEFQRTGNKPWEVKPKKPATKKTKEVKVLPKYVQSIVDKHDSLKGYTKDMKKELQEIVQTWDERSQTLYDKLADKFASNDYNINAKGKGAHYAPYDKKVNMGMKKNTWEQHIGSQRTGAWHTKFHEEFHQLDHILGKTSLANSKFGSPINYVDKLTDPRTAVGSKMLKAINEDIYEAVNTAVDKWNTANPQSKVAKITDFLDLDKQNSSVFMEWLQNEYPTGKDRACIGMFTDAMGLATENGLSPHRNGFWGHDASYNMNRGVAGATSETWATFGSLKLQGEPEVYDVMKKLMTKTLDAYEEIYDEVLKYAETEVIDYN